MDALAFEKEPVIQYSLKKNIYALQNKQKKFSFISHRKQEQERTSPLFLISSESIWGTSSTQELKKPTKGLFLLQRGTDGLFGWKMIIM